MVIEEGKLYRSEIGEKIGPMVDCGFSDGFPYHGGKGKGFYSAEGKRSNPHGSDLIAEWTDAPTGPVRTVTRKEIVSGQYGIVKVDADRPTGNPRIIVSAVPTASELRAAIATLTEIADALEEQ